jgi:hypothetical protein
MRAENEGLLVSYLFSVDKGGNLSPCTPAIPCDDLVRREELRWAVSQRRPLVSRNMGRGRDGVVCLNDDLLEVAFSSASDERAVASWRM